jgi:hypothetical protein
MNDRFKDLALECIVENIAAPAWVFTDAEFEKFAKLIVDECAGVISATEEGARQLPSEVALHLAKKNVLTYFGIE